MNCTCGIYFVMMTCCVLTTSVEAQQHPFSIRGRLVDSISHDAIGNASLTLMSKTNSLSKFFTVATSDGQFEFNPARSGDYHLIVSYQKQNVFDTLITLNDRQKVNLGDIALYNLQTVLPVVVVSKAPPVSIRKDTITFQAGAFKTKENASVEDLLKMLPGIQVDKEGNVRSQGNEVQKIYVGGKQFFADDPKLATRNLTADMIEEVQVFNDLSEQAKFNGIDDGSRYKTINLKLKEDKKTGIFGNAFAGFGTKNRYHAGVSANFFNDASLLSVIGNSNNINSPIGSSTQQSTLPGVSSSAPFASGLNKSSSLGANFQSYLGKRVEFSGSYMYVKEEIVNDRNAFRETILNDSTLFTNRQSHYVVGNERQQVNMKFTFRLDSANVIEYQPVLTLNNFKSISREQFTNAVKKNGDTTGVSGNVNNSEASGRPLYYSNNLIWKRKFNKPGRTFSVSFVQSANKNYTSALSAINKQADTANLNVENDERKFRSRNNMERNIFSTTMSYTEPVAVKKIVELNFSYSRDNNYADRDAYNYNPLSKNYDKQNNTLTNELTQTRQASRIGANLKGSDKYLSYQVGASVEQLELKSNDFTKSDALSQRFNNVLPAASLSVQMSRNRSLQLQYRSRSNQPDIRQMQDVTDIVGYPYINKGNPLLKQEYTHTAGLSYNSFNNKNLRSVFLNVALTAIHNKISSSLQQMANEQISTPVNLDGSYILSGTFGVSIPLKVIEGLTLNTTSQVDYFRNGNIVNGVLNYNNDFVLSQNLLFNYNAGKELNFDVSLNGSYNKLSYGIAGAPGNSYVSGSITFNGGYNLTNDFSFTTALDYTTISGATGAYDKDVLILNAGIEQKLLKNRKAALKLIVNNIFNNHVSISRTRGANYIEDITYTTLGRYALLTFIYRLNKGNNK